MLFFTFRMLVFFFLFWWFMLIFLVFFRFMLFIFFVFFGFLFFVFVNSIQLIWVDQLFWLNRSLIFLIYNFRFISNLIRFFLCHFRPNLFIIQLRLHIWSLLIIRILELNLTQVRILNCPPHFIVMLTGVVEGHLAKNLEYFLFSGWDVGNLILY